MKIQIENMNKDFVFLPFFLFLLLSSIKLAIAGSNDVWAECGSSQYPIYIGSKTISGTTYYCCPGPQWQKSASCQITECNYCYIRNLNCPESVEPGEEFTISFEFNGTGPTYKYEHRSLWQDGTRIRCNYGVDWGDCQWHSDSFTITAPSTPGIYTYTVKCFGSKYASESNCDSSDDAKSCTITVGTTTTTTTSTTTTTTTQPGGGGGGGGGGTTTTIPTGCGNTICEYAKNENQINCPSDCYTTLTVYTETNKIVTPNTQLIPNQQLRLVLTFNDSRYNSNQGFNLKLDATIDGIPWDISNGCKMCGKSLEEMGCNASQRGNKKWWNSSEYNVSIYMENGYAKIEFFAKLPSNLNPGPHKIKVTPILLSFPVTLRAAEAQFRVGNGFYNFVLIVKQIFNRLTSFFVYR
jgi:hypothetical protein